LKWILEKQFLALNGTEDFQYHRLWGSDMNRIVLSGCGATAGYFRVVGLRPGTFGLWGYGRVLSGCGATAGYFASQST